jgi:hypothetical protein
MFLPDRKHIHHQLIALGLSHRSVVLVLYCVSALFGIGALAVTALHNTDASFVMILFGIILFAGIKQLRYKEMAILSNGVLLPLYEWPPFRRRLVQAGIDLACGVAAFLAAVFVMEESGRVMTSKIPFIAAAAGGMQIAVFSLCGLYKSSFRYAGIGEALRIIKANVLSAAAVGFLFTAAAPFGMTLSVATTVAYFYFCLSLVGGSRLLHTVLLYSFQRSHTGGRNVLIYGAQANGILTLQYILNNRQLHLRPIGFCDDDPQLERKQVGGYTVFGGHWILAKLMRRSPFDEIIIASDTMKPEILHRIAAFADEHQIVIRRRNILFEEVPVAAASIRSPKRPASYTPVPGNGIPASRTI